MAEPLGGIGRRLAEIRAQQLVENLAMAFGGLHPHQGALAAQDGQDLHEQHPPLGEPDVASHAAIRQDLEEADQIVGSNRIGRQGRQRS